MSILFIVGCVLNMIAFIGTIFFVLVGKTASTAKEDNVGMWGFFISLLAFLLLLAFNFGLLVSMAFN